MTIPEGDDPHHEFAALYGLDDDDLETTLETHSAALRAALGRHKAELATKFWHDLGPDGLLIVFRTINHNALETFLRDHRTPIPRRPAKPDALAIFKRGNQDGPNRIGTFLHWLGLGIAYDVTAFVETDDREGFEKWRAEYPDGVIAASVGGDFFCHKSSGARALRALRWTGLLPEILAEDPELIEHEKAIEAAVEAGRQRVGEELYEAETTRAVETLALALVDGDIEPTALYDVFGAAVRALSTEAESLGEFFDLASELELPDREPIEGTRRLLNALDALWALVGPALEAYDIENLPALGTWERALEMFAEMKEHDAAETRGVRIATLVGPDGLADVVARLVQGALDPTSDLHPLCSALEALIDAANAPDPDPVTLSPLEATARAADPDGSFSAVITAGLMGRLSFAQARGGDDEGETAPLTRPAGDAPRGEPAPAPQAPSTAEISTAPADAAPESTSTSAGKGAHSDAAPGDPVPDASTSATQAALPAHQSTTGSANATRRASSSHPSPARSAPLSEATARAPVSLETIDEPTPEEYYDKGIAAALAAGDLGIACWAAKAAGRPDRLLSLAHVATSLRGSRGPLSETASSLASEVIATGFEGSTRPSQLVGWAAATLGAVVAPETALGDVAERLAAMLGTDEAVELSAAVQRVARRGFSVPEHGLGVVADLATLDDEVTEKAQALAERLGPKRFKFSVATSVWNEWVSSGGLLAPFSKAAADDRTALAAVRALVSALSEKRALERAMDESERRQRTKNSTKRIEGSAKQHLLGAGRDAVEAAAAWCNALEAHTRRASLTRGADEEAAAELREAADRVRETLLSAFSATEPGATGAKRILETFYALLDGTALRGREFERAKVLAEPLARSAQRMAPDYSPPGPLDFDAVLAGLEHDAVEAIGIKLAADDFVAATVLLAALEANGAGTPEIDDAYEAAIEDARRRAGALAATTQVLLDRARRQLYVDEDTYAALSGHLAQAADAARPAGRLDVDAALEELAGLEAMLDAARDEKLARFAAETTALCESNPDFAQKVAALLAEGDLATAVELKEAVERGEELAESNENAFIVSSFFPAVPDALAGGIDTEVLGALRERRRLGPLDFSELSTEAAERVAEAFEAWNLRVKTKPSSLADELAVLKPALRLLGIEARAIERNATRDIPSSPQRGWFDLTGVSLTGKALLPAFGSDSAGRIRVMVVSGKPSAEQICEWIRQDRADRAVLVLHAGTMAPSVRRALAAKMRLAKDKTTAVVDDAVLAWLGALGGSRFDLTMRSTLPFASATPYLPPSGDCPIEMFYGRGAQVQDVQRANGTCLVYGGRQLGKSALLKTAMREFNSVHDQYAFYIDLKSPIESSRTPETVWRLIAERLGDIETLNLPRAVPKDPRPAVAAAVNTWLDDHDTGRILILLDEADLYFDLDANSNFVITSELKDLMDARGRRFKVVWAGLHQVRRFATVSNHPIAHLGTASVIGQLDPTPAYRLVEQPTSALGLRFNSDALVNRILAYCNYQPVLLHLFAKALLEDTFSRAGDARRAAVPQIITEADVEAVADSPILQAAVRERLHWTLELDPRYKVITYAAAYEAHTQGEGVALSSHELRSASERWWRAGFANVDPAEFRSLLEELVGLGVLSADTGGEGWRLRSANVVRLLGTLEQVESALLEEEEREPTVLVAGEVREPIGEGARSPISAAQLADLVGVGSNQVRIVVGTHATDADLLERALAFEAAKPSAPFELVTPPNRSAYQRALGEGSPTHQRVVFSDLRAVGAEGCAESLAAALDKRPSTGTRAVILLVDARRSEFWGPLAEPKQPTAGVEVVALRRYDRSSLRAWATTHDAAFQDESDRAALAELTGGWPCLVDLADEAVAQNPSSAASLAMVRSRLSSEPDHAEVLVSTFDGAPPELTEVFTMLAESPSTLMDPADIGEVAEGTCEDPSRLVPMLRALGALRVDAEGKVGAEPHLAEAWLASEASAVAAPAV